MAGIDGGPPATCVRPDQVGRDGTAVFGRKLARYFFSRSMLGAGPVAMIGRPCPLPPRQAGQRAFVTALGGIGMAAILAPNPCVCVPPGMRHSEGTVELPPSGTRADCQGRKEGAAGAGTQLASKDF